MITDEKLREFISKEIKSQKANLDTFWSIEAIMRAAKSQLDFTKDLAVQKLHWFDITGDLMIFDFSKL